MPSGYSLMILAVLVLQIILLGASFPITELFTGVPLLRVDTPYHWYLLWVAAQLGVDGLWSGYNPFMSAGYIDGIVANTSSKLPAVLAHFLGPEADVAKIFKIFTFVEGVLAPACVPLAARFLRLDFWTTVLATCFGVILWWTSDFRNFYSVGMVAFVTATYAALAYCAGLAVLFSGRHGIWFAVLAGLAGAFLLLLHPLFPIAPFFAMTLWAIIHRGEWNWKHVAIVALPVAAIPAATNTWWLIATTKYSELSLYPVVVQAAVGLELLHTHLGTLSLAAPFRVLLLLLAIWSAFRLRGSAGGRMALWLMLSGVAITCYGLFGATIPGVFVLQPNRFIVVGILFLVVPAAQAVRVMVLDLQSGAPRRRIVLAGVLASVAFASAYYLREVVREATPGPHGHYGMAPPNVRGEGATTRWLIEWLRSNTSPESRILFENVSLGYDGGHIAGYLAGRAGREFIGGGYPVDMPTGFKNSRFSGTDIEDFEPRELLSVLRAYNVGVVIAKTPRAVAYLDRFPYAVKAARFGDVQVFRVPDAPGYFAEGAGRVTGRRVNRLMLRDLKGERVTIRYHFVPRLHTDPPVELRPVWVEGGLKPFISIDNPPRQLDLFFR